RTRCGLQNILNVDRKETPLQFIRVTFPGARTVFVDGGANGRTGRTLRVEEGPHSVSLGKPVNYSPSEQAINPFGTSLENPEVVPFSSLGSVMTMSAMKAVRPPGKASKRKKTSGGRKAERTQTAGKKGKKKRTKKVGQKALRDRN